VPDPTQEDSERLRDLEQQLEARLGGAETTQAERQGAELAREWLRERLKEVPPDERIRLMTEARRYLASLDPKQ
jgi:hypothetical protein